MGTVTTSTNTNPILYPGHTRIDYGLTDGSLWVLVLNNSGNIELSRSLNNGTSWSVISTLVRANLQDVSMYMPAAGTVHVVYRTNESSQDRVYWRKYVPSTATWTSEVLVASSSNGGVAGAVYTGLDVVGVGAGGAEYVAVAIGLTSGSNHGIVLKGVYVAAGQSGGVASAGMFRGPTTYVQSGSGRVGPALDIESIGNGKSSNVPHLWVTFGRARINVISCTWTGYGWVTPDSSWIMIASVPAQNSIRGSFDGRRHLTASANPNATSTVAVYERNRSHTGSTTTRTSPTHPAGVVRSCSISYDYSSDDFRVYAVGTSNADLYYTTYDRSAGSWSSWTAVTTTDVLGATPENYAVRRNAYGNARFDVLIAHTGAPNTIVHYPVTQAYSPSQPTWAIQGGIAKWAAAALLLDWVFSDVDPADAQTAYALSRQVGVDTIEYWQASTGTWQPTEQKNTSATTQVTLPAGFVDRFDAGVVAAWNPSNSTFVATTAQSRSGGKAALLTSVGTPLVASAHYVEFPVTPAASYSAELWGMSIAGYSAFLATINWYTSGHVYISTSSSPSTALAAGVWGRRSITAAAPGTAAFAQVGPTIGASPPAATAVYVDDVSFGATPTPWAAETDAAHTYKVKVWDGTDLPSIYSEGIVFIPSEMYVPVITSPAPAAVVTGDTLTVTWTVTEQSAYRVRLWKSGVEEFDSGFLAGTVLTFDVPVTLVDSASYTVGVTSRNNEGLESTEDVNAFTTNFEEPATPTLAFTPSTSGGYIRVVITNPTPAGPQPAVLSQDLYRRPVTAQTPEIRVAAGLASGATYDDWTAASGIAYEYRSHVRGVNGASTYSVWTA